MVSVRTRDRIAMAQPTLTKMAAVTAAASGYGLPSAAIKIAMQAGAVRPPTIAVTW